MIKSNNMTVAVVGSRGVVRNAALARRLTELMPALVVSGGAAGADALAASWARANGVPLLELRPDYAAHGAGAPHVRNAEIVRRADLVLAVWDGRSKGTLSALKAARRLGRPYELLPLD
ncbi:SLOG family protein [Hymenobacter jeollabukensis]|uniref:DUF2493 domain-containing protein n=1 Tax=Hymenobacter jeollabukensis TaxID=2025313 RepID=A0A5R8WGW7_9BACT|nr:SLOG family protein [Hymenobacter jeollabukensis]TLM87301.1 DUF2493 domain-containing protein [Hymenobacter jeollabukensis]